MFDFTKKYKDAYKKEVLKQTNPYMYYVENIEMNKQASEKCQRHFLLSSYGENDISKLENPVKETKTHRVYSFAGCFIFEKIDGYSSTFEKLLLIEALKENDACLAYSDSDKVTNDGVRFAPFFKQNYYRDSFDSYNYIDEFYAVKEEMSECSIEEMKKIYHVEKILYHGYFDISNYETDEDIANNVSESVYTGVYEETVRNYQEPDYLNDESILNDTVSVVIPSKDNVDLIKTCLESLRISKNESNVRLIETVVVDNGSNDENKSKIEEIIASYNDINAMYIYKKMDFNFSRMCNDGANKTTGDYLLFLNDDIEVIDKLFLLKLLYHARKPYAGCVGPKLLYPDGKLIQHAGLVDLKLCGPSHMLSHFTDDKVQYYGANRMVRNMLAVTGACLMVSRAKYFKNNGFCDKMEIGYNDVDLCICMYESGYLNIQVNDTVLYHHESVTRGSDTISDEKYSRLKSERELLYERHPYLRKTGDPFYNINLPEDSIEYRVKVEADAFKKNVASKEVCIDVRRMSKLICKKSKRAHMNIENKLIERAIFDEGDFYIVSGWAVLEKRDNCLYDRALIIWEKDGGTAHIKAYEMLPVYREDVSKVFESAVNAELSGFKVKIPLEHIDKNKEYEMGVVFTSKITKKRYYAGQ